ncbi:class II fructose-bisphosphate aldolase [Microbacterium sp. AISO3]|jgi:fructose-bisphosphate aldolase, class II|uniref:Fructose-bisphosphate aldolase n=2 Tax=Microbacterium TaxID=33882 RepID=A0ABU1HZ84_9MICO|nr:MULTISPECIES: class II fructose-bisphosphate aldolase [Microbacterium]MDR6166572.1 fructose-bisphosphate aldolase class II [Microbacterium paludicola]OAZ39463.1 class II fructose-bisphosphate aldolase [Microbacterium arborescens]OWP23061.1 class II fructose-bisphosphate aldolase [Microbacterium sp. AISO3]QCR40569.1 class II fructose-bisphosphate aldolase [Microbacterium sp. SGAir0570]
MPIATPEQYAEMLDRAKAGGFAYPAINAASSQSINAVLQGLTEAGSDGIIQVTTGGADYFAGHTVKGRATGALAFAKFAHEVAKNYPITVALHTDHCPKPALDDFLLPLIAASEEAVADGGQPIFQSHMWDGSAVPLAENIEIAKELLPRIKAIRAILEVEIGVVGGEEDGVQHEGSNDALYTTTGDVSQVVEALGLGDQGRWIAALTFGNVHGVYKPGNVKLKPELLGEIQAGIASKFGTGEKPLDLVFHGGSGSTDEEIALAVANGVVKMNIDTDTQYAFTRSVAGFMFQNYDGVLKVDGEVGNKKAYDPRAWGKKAESAMAARVVEATKQLGSFGQSQS